MSKEELKLKGTNVEKKKTTTRKKVSTPENVDEKVEKVAKKPTSKKTAEKTKTTETKKTTTTKKAAVAKKTTTKKVEDVKETKTKKEAVSKAEVKETKPKEVKTTTAKKTTKTAKIAEPTKKVEKPAKVAKETKATTKSTSTKTTKTGATKKAEPKTASKKSSTTKKTATKVAKKEPSSKTTNSSKKSETKITKKDNKVTPNTEKEIIKEETIIEKIKSFIAKIAAMQEEARKEALEAKEEKETTRKVAKKASKEVNEAPVYLPEYYDLPYRYNETIVKILAQTPKKIFVYWDIADEDRLKYQRAFGDDFFEKTYPVLLLHNNDKGYTREIPINDFANSWYINIDDAKTNYTIQLGRKFKQVPVNIDTKKIEIEHNIILRTDYLPIAQSNILEVPNDRILFAALPKIIKFRNVKTYEEKEQVVSEIKTTYGNMYNIREFYKENYKEEIDEEIIGLNNPTSGGLSSSSFK